MIRRGAYLTGRALQFIALEVSGLQRAAGVLAIFALLSSALGLVRNRIFAHMFGAGTTLDLYNTAFTVPDFIFVAMGALVSVYILIPELARRAPEDQRDYVDTIAVGFSLLAVAVALTAAFIAPFIFQILFPKFAHAGLLPALTELTRIMLLQPVFLGLSNIFAAITQSRRRYLLYAISPLLYNAGIIFGTVVLYPFMGITGLAWGVVGGAMLHAGIQLPSILKDGFFKRMPRLHSASDLFSTFIVSVPRALALSMTQIAYIGLIALAALLTAGSIAIFKFAYDLQAVPLSVIGASYSVAAFPGLAAALAKGQRQEFLNHVAAAARHIFFWSLPATALVIVLRAHIVRVILGSGAFNWNDTRLTAAAFALFAVSLSAQGLMLLIVRAYYAAGRTFIPFFISAATAAFTVLIGAVAVGALHIPFVLNAVASILRVVDVPGSSLLGLAFAYALVNIAGAVALTAHFEHRFGGFLKMVRVSWMQSLLASIVCGAGAYLMLNIVGPITFSSTLLTVFVRGLGGGIAGMAACAAVYALIGNREYKETVAAIRGRIRRAALSPSTVAAAEELGI